jgi:hypothetical protein
MGGCFPGGNAHQPEPPGRKFQKPFMVAESIILNPFIIHLSRNPGGKTRCVKGRDIINAGFSHAAVLEGVRGIPARWGDHAIPGNDDPAFKSSVSHI